MKTNNQSTSLPNQAEKLSTEIESILSAKEEVYKLIESEKKAQKFHFNKRWTTEKELDKASNTRNEKELKKQIAQEKNLEKSHLRKQFSLEKKLVTLEKNLTKKRLSLQKILVKRAEENAITTKKKSDIDYLNKLTKELKQLETRWEAFTEIPWR